MKTEIRRPICGRRIDARSLDIKTPQSCWRCGYATLIFLSRLKIRIQYSPIASSSKISVRNSIATVTTTFQAIVSPTAKGFARYRISPCDRNVKRRLLGSSAKHTSDVVSVGKIHIPRPRTGHVLKRFYDAGVIATESSRNCETVQCHGWISVWHGQANVNQPILRLTLFRLPDGVRLNCNRPIGGLSEVRNQRLSERTTDKQEYGQSLVEISSFWLPSCCCDCTHQSRKPLASFSSGPTSIGKINGTTAFK